MQRNLGHIVEAEGGGGWRVGILRCCESVCGSPHHTQLHHLATTSSYSHIVTLPCQHHRITAMTSRHHSHQIQHTSRSVVTISLSSHLVITSSLSSRQHIIRPRQDIIGLCRHVVTVIHHHVASPRHHNISVIAARHHNLITSHVTRSRHLQHLLESFLRGATGIKLGDFKMR